MKLLFGMSMGSISEYLLFVLGLAMLLGGAELLVRNAVVLASMIGRSRFFIGLTVTAFGTSAPELSIGVVGIIKDHADVGLGAIVGSNIFNILFILGLTALIKPILVDQKVIRRDIPILLGLSILFYLLSLNGRIGILESVVLALLFVGYLAYIARSSVEKGHLVLPDMEASPNGPLSGLVLTKKISLIVLSLGLLIVGSRMLVAGAISLATQFGVNELTIGLTIVAMGTSLPEIATTLAAIRKNEHGMALGNVMGSNIFNIIVVPAAMTLVKQGALPIPDSVIVFDLPVMLVAVIACLPIFISGKQMSRMEGALFLAYYVVFMLTLYIKASSDSVFAEYKTPLAILAIPVLVSTLIIISIRALKYRSQT